MGSTKDPPWNTDTQLSPRIETNQPLKSWHLDNHGGHSIGPPVFEVFQVVNLRGSYTHKSVKKC